MHSGKGDNNKYKDKHGLVDHLKSLAEQDAYHRVCHAYFSTEN